MELTELLFEGIEIDDVDLVQQLLAQGVYLCARVDGYDILSATALSPRQQGTNIEIIKLLLTT